VGCTTGSRGGVLRERKPEINDDGDDDDDDDDDDGYDDTNNALDSDASAEGVVCPAESHDG
jgi:hypothetical protein